MKTIPLLMVSLALSLAGCRHAGDGTSEVLTNGGSVGEFKGFDAIDQYVKDRLVDAPAGSPGTGSGFSSGFPPGGFSQSFSLAQYVNQDDGLKTILGVYVQVGGSTVFENAKPNALNLALWKSVFDRFAADVSQGCAPGPATVSFTLRADFAAKLKTVCQWPAATAKDPAALQALWIAVMGYQAPESEYTAWSSWFKTQAAYAQMQGQDVVKAMLVTILMNPYYLLSH